MDPDRPGRERAGPLSAICSRVRELLGIDTGSERFSYARDDTFGVMSRVKVPARWVRTTCGYCSVGCGMLLGVSEGKVVSVRGDPAHPVNEGKLCPKGLAEHYVIDAPGRAVLPLLADGKGFRRVDWDEALRVFAAKVREVQAAHGPEAFAVLSTGQLVTEELYALGKLVQLGIGSRNYDGNTTLCMATAVSGYKRSFGSDGPPGCYEDLETAEVVVLIGANIADNHPILASRLFRNLDRADRGKVIVVDPRATKTAMLADIFLPIRPRSDVDLLNGLAALVIREGWVQEDWVREHATGYDALAEHLEPWSLSRTAERTGLTEGQVYEAGRLIGTSRSVLFAWTMGVNHSTQGTETVNAINNLALLTGNVGVRGGSPLSITGQCNAMGSREASFTSSPPGYRRWDRDQDRRELAALWGVAPERIPAERGLAYPDIIQGILDGRIRGLWVIATNPVVSYPEQARLRAALASLDFLVVQDGYHPTPTSDLADLVLPAAIWGEKEGTYTNSERRVSKVNAAVEPPGEARTDFRIFLDIAEELGVRESLFPGWTGPRDAFEEWREVSRGRLCDCSGMTWETIEASGGIQWPASEETPGGTSRLYSDGCFQTDDGKAVLFRVAPEAPPEVPDEVFPFILNTGRTVEHWHTRTKTGRVALLERSAPEAWIEMNPVDAARIQVSNHDLVSVRSRRGRLERVRARVTSTVAPGQVFIPFHFPERNVNQLTIDACDPISREPNFKQAAVRVEKVER